MHPHTQLQHFEVSAKNKLDGPSLSPAYVGRILLWLISFPLYFSPSQMKACQKGSNKLCSLAIVFQSDIEPMWEFPSHNSFCPISVGFIHGLFEGRNFSLLSHLMYQKQRNPKIHCETLETLHLYGWTICQQNLSQRGATHPFLFTEPLLDSLFYSQSSKWSIVS